jgi:hypothetical protein
MGKLDRIHSIVFIVFFLCHYFEIINDWKKERKEKQTENDKIWCLFYVDTLRTSSERDSYVWERNMEEIIYLDWLIIYWGIVKFQNFRNS